MRKPKKPTVPKKNASPPELVVHHEKSPLEAIAQRGSEDARDGILFLSEDEMYAENDRLIEVWAKHDFKSEGNREEYEDILADYQDNFEGTSAVGNMYENMLATNEPLQYEVIQRIVAALPVGYTNLSFAPGNYDDGGLIHYSLPKCKSEYKRQKILFEARFKLHEKHLVVWEDEMRKYRTHQKNEKIKKLEAQLKKAKKNI